MKIELSSLIHNCAWHVKYYITEYNQKGNGEETSFLLICIT